MDGLRPPLPFWLRWSWRDLRRRWAQVAAIAAIVALGTGTYSGLSSTSEWRRRSYDASYAQLAMHDLRVELGEGNYVDAAALVRAVRSIPSAGEIEDAEPRLVVRTQVDASHGGRTVLVPGRVIGVPVDDGGPRVDRLDPVRGRALRASDAGNPTAVIDAHFAKRYSLPTDATIRVSGDRELQLVGQALQPEYFYVTGERGDLLAEANFAVLFAPLATVQSLADRPGAANDLVLTLAPGSDRAAIERELDEALGSAFPDVGFEILDRRDDAAYRLLYDDIEGDQRFYNIFSLLILFGAAFAAFNLTGRIVEAQRREIGIGMALGTSPAELAIRPGLLGVQVIALGALAGVGVGVVVGRLMRNLLREYLPLPAWETPFLPGVFARGALLGLAVPLVAVAIPVWRAVRVAPVDAIRTNAATPRGGGLSWLLARVPVPGRSTAQIPVRNVLRAPRRTAMTALGISAAIAVLIGVVGMIDSFTATIDDAAAELERTNPDRIAVTLDSFYPVDSPVVAGVAGDAAVGMAEPQLRLGGKVRRGDTTIDVLLDLAPLDSEIWAPTQRDPVTGPATEGGEPGIVLSEVAARDLGVRPGDTVQLEHPRREGLTSYRWVESEVPVVGLSVLPTRFTASMDLDAARLMDLEGITNAIVVTAAPGTSIDEVKRALFTLPGVASVQPVRTYTDTIRSELDRVFGFLVVVEGVVLLLALLIAFNSASINNDERRREHATMFAFGLRVRSVLRMTVVESVFVGILGTVVGLGVGWLLLDWIVGTLLPETLPDLGIVTHVSPRTVLTACALGIVAVALAPVLTVRRLASMDVPSTLRVME